MLCTVSDSALRVSQRVLHFLNQIVQMPHIFVVLGAHKDVSLSLNELQCPLNRPGKIDRQRHSCRCAFRAASWWRSRIEMLETALGVIAADRDPFMGASWTTRLSAQLVGLNTTLSSRSSCYVRRCFWSVLYSAVLTRYNVTTRTRRSYGR